MKSLWYQLLQYHLLKLEKDAQQAFGCKSLFCSSDIKGINKNKKLAHKLTSKRIGGGQAPRISQFFSLFTGISSPTWHTHMKHLKTYCKVNTVHMSHLKTYSKFNGRVEFRAHFLRQKVAESRRILSNKFRTLTCLWCDVMWYFGCEMMQTDSANMEFRRFYNMEFRRFFCHTNTKGWQHQSLLNARRWC